MNVLSQYGLAVAGLRWVPVEGGFSGAHVWRGEDTSPIFALKAHPPHITPEHISQVHAWMRRAAHLPFVPAVVPTTQHTTTATADGRVWELVRWMPGEPGLTTPTRRKNAVAALAELHRAWKPPTPQFAPCPGVLRRLAVLRNHIAAGLPAVLLDNSQRRRVNPPLYEMAVHALLPWADRPLPVQPCLCDIHADHVLFEGDAVTGVIDFAAMKLDHVAVDLARLLGSTAEDDFAEAVSEYRALGETPIDLDFVRLLDCTGALCAVAVWCRRLAAEPLPPPRFRDRLQQLLRRVEAILPAHFMASA